MSVLNQTKIREDILNFIRNSDIFSIEERNVTTQTETINVNSTTSEVTLSNLAVMNVRSVTKNSIPLTVYVDYDLNILNKSPVESRVISFTEDLVDGDVLEIVYDSNNDSTNEGEKIWAEYDEKYFTLNTVPRIGFNIQSIGSRNRSANDSLQQKSVLIDFYIVGQKVHVENLRESYYGLIFDNRKNFNWLNLLRPNGQSSIKPLLGNKTQTFYVQIFSFIAPTEFEI